MRRARIKQSRDAGATHPRVGSPEPSAAYREPLHEDPTSGALFVTAGHTRSRIGTSRNADFRNAGCCNADRK